ncbi:MAG: LacI family DNA-binding transcriptional regulator [Bifidobacterium psychraerophilum]|uniref:LacI family DNA-binding transcriptional regulator n=1 Tax=Bifidobacterium psychraerophilum TaxID=218140 RepID=UPI0039E95731
MDASTQQTTPKSTLTPPKKVTIRDVASLAGVSYGTVSRYLNGNEHVSSAAATSIAKAIQHSRYVPNNAARSLAQRKTQVVALIIQVEADATIAQASVSAVMSSANQTLGDAGFQMVTLIANTDQSTSRIARLVQSDFADGYILFSMSNDDSLTTVFLHANRPVVLSEYDEDSELPFPAVDFANEQGQQAITQYLLDRGHKRLAYICGPGYSPSAINRLRGFQEAVGTAFDPSLLFYADDWEISSGELAVVEFQPYLDSLDGVVCANDSIAIGVINQLGRMGYRVPGDIAVTGFDDSPYAMMSECKLTTVRQDSSRHGKTLAELLLRQLAGEAIGKQLIQLPTELVIRQSA